MANNSTELDNSFELDNSSVLFINYTYANLAITTDITADNYNNSDTVSLTGARNFTLDKIADFNKCYSNGTLYSTRGKDAIVKVPGYKCILPESKLKLSKLTNNDLVCVCLPDFTNYGIPARDPLTVLNADSKSIFVNGNGDLLTAADVLNSLTEQGALTTRNILYQYELPFRLVDDEGNIISYGIYWWIIIIVILFLIILVVFAIVYWKKKKHKNY